MHSCPQRVIRLVVSAYHAYYSRTRCLPEIIGFRVYGELHGQPRRRVRPRCGLQLRQHGGGSWGVGDVVRDPGLGTDDAISGPRSRKTTLKGLGIQIQFQLNGVCIFFPTRLVTNQLADNLPSWF